MSTCGYVCPLCEGKKILESGNFCDWCSSSESITKKHIENTKDSEVHNDTLSEKDSISLNANSSELQSTESTA